MVICNKKIETHLVFNLHSSEAIALDSSPPFTQKDFSEYVSLSLVQRRQLQSIYKSTTLGCWCHSDVTLVLVSLQCHSGAGVTPVSLWCWCHSGVTPVWVSLRCHSGAGVTPVSLRCWCHSSVTLVLVSFRCWCHTGVTLVFVSI